MSFDPDNPTPGHIGCVEVTKARLDLGLDPLYEQVWNLTELAIGDLASTIGLAPGEQLTLEFLQTQRKVLDRTVIESTESLDTNESTSSDKEAINIARSASKTESWHVDTTGTVSVGVASLSTTVGYAQSVTESNQQAINHVAESTRKSAHALRSLHKISVRGVSESLVSHRMTRVIRNPYLDRTLSLNVFQLVKRFCVETGLKETRGAIVIHVGALLFDTAFVAANGEFLDESLLDTSLRDSLAMAHQGGRPTGEARNTAAAIARRALRLLFDDPNIFNVPWKNGVDANLPSTSFTALPDNPNIWDSSALNDAVSNHLGGLFTAVNAFYHLSRDVDPKTGDLLTDVDGEHAIRLAMAIAADVKDKWETIYPDPTASPAATDLQRIMDLSHFTEVFRRLPGFLALVKGALAPLLGPATLEAEAELAQRQAEYVLSRLVMHLNCNSNYYVQEYLRYVARRTSNQAIIDFVREVLGDPVMAIMMKGATNVFDVDRAFINRQEIIVPTYNPLSASQIAALGNASSIDAAAAIDDPVTVAMAIDAPCDGIHLEVAEGACVLENVPAAADRVSLSLQGAALSVNG